LTQGKKGLNAVNVKKILVYILCKLLRFSPGKPGLFFYSDKYVPDKKQFQNFFHIPDLSKLKAVIIDHRTTIYIYREQIVRMQGSDTYQEIRAGW